MQSLQGLYQVMEPVNGSIVIVREPFANGGFRHGLFFFTNMRQEYRVGVAFLLDSAQPSVIGGL